MKTVKIILYVLAAITVALLLWAVGTKGADTAISMNLIWGYTLLIGAIALAIISAIVGMLKDPRGLAKTLVSVILIIVVIGGAVAIAFAHKGLTIPNSAGGVFDNPTELIITEASILVTYIAGAAAILIAIYSVVRNALK